MNLRKSLLAFFCLTAAAGLVAGMPGQFRLVSLALITVLAAAWAVKPVRSFNWFGSIGLGIYTCCTAAGLLVGGVEVFLVIGEIAALAAWDLILFGQSLEGAEENPGIRSCVLEHIKSLGLALGLGALLVIPMLLIRIQLPFIVMLVVLASAAASLLFALRFLQKKNSP